MYYNSCGYNFLTPIEGIFILFGWIIFVVFIIMIFRYIKGGHKSLYHHSIFSTKEDPIDILKVRYAKGEITKEEYLDIIKILEK